MTPQDRGKNAAASAAAKLIKNGQTIGLGTGTTARFFIERLSERIKAEGLIVKAVATSQKSSEMALKGGIELLDPNLVETLDVCVDGADEIDEKHRMIKGGGGALLREKIVASTAREMIIIVDNTKVVPHLGAFPLAVEILPFGSAATAFKLKANGFHGAFRRTKEGSLFFTDNGNLIFDIRFPSPIENPEEVDRQLKQIPGVLETGFFFHLAKKVIIGFPDGRVKIVD